MVRTVRRCWGGIFCLRIRSRAICMGTGLVVRRGFSSGHRQRVLQDGTWSVFWRLFSFVLEEWPTFFRSLEYHVEFLHAVVDQGDFVVAHHELHHVCFYTAFRTRHCAGHNSSPNEEKEKRRIEQVCWSMEDLDVRNKMRYDLLFTYSVLVFDIVLGTLVCNCCFNLDSLLIDRRC